jgi:hypothetical protein
MHTLCKGCIHKNWTGTEAENKKGKGGSIKCDAVDCHCTSDCHPNVLVVNRQALFLTSTTGGGSKPQTQPKCDLGMCEEGKEKDAAHHCDECDSFLCDSCKTVHTKLKGTRSHAAQTVAEFASSGGGVAQDGGAGGRMCAIHPDKPLAVFCNTCKTLICLMVSAQGLVVVCVRASV